MSARASSTKASINGKVACFLLPHNRFDLLPFFHVQIDMILFFFWLENWVTGHFFVCGWIRSHDWYKLVDMLREKVESLAGCVVQFGRTLFITLLFIQLFKNCQKKFIFLNFATQKVTITSTLRIYHKNDHFSANSH